MISSPYSENSGGWWIRKSLLWPFTSFIYSENENLLFVCLRAFFLIFYINENGTPPVFWEWVLILQGASQCFSRATQCQIQPPKRLVRHCTSWPFNAILLFINPSANVPPPPPPALSHWKHSTVETRKFVIAFLFSVCFLMSWQQNQSSESFQKTTETDSITKAFKIWNPRKLISASF